MLSEKKEEIMEALEEVMEDGLPGKRALSWKTAAAAVLILAVLAGGLYLSWSRQSQLRRQLEQQAAQIERQNQLIEALEDDGHTSPKPIPVITSETLKSQINALQELVTQEYIYTNADRRTDNVKWLFNWTRPFSGTSLLVTYDGSIKAGVDLGEAQVDVDEETREITITLPPSRITDNNIPQESITVVEVKNGLFNEVTFDDYNTFISEQKVIMESKAIERGILEKASEEARKSIEAFLAPLPGLTGKDAYSLEIK